MNPCELMLMISAVRDNNITALNPCRSTSYSFLSLGFHRLTPRRNLHLTFPITFEPYINVKRIKKMKNKEKIYCRIVKLILLVSTLRNVY